jgi:hypothetical protein
VSNPPVLVAMGPCFVHGAVFLFDPDRVTSVLVDPVTGAPPDVDPDPATPDMDDRVARSVRRPICPLCCKFLNDTAAAQGRGRPFDETDTSGGQVQQ